MSSNEKKVVSPGDIWDIKAIDAQIDALKGSLNALKGPLGTAQGSYCRGDVTCNTYANLIAVCAAHMAVVDNEIKWLTQMKKFITFNMPNKGYAEVDEYKGP